jgi:hypothetical protein
VRKSVMYLQATLIPSSFLISARTRAFLNCQYKNFALTAWITNLNSRDNRYGDEQRFSTSSDPNYPFALHRCTATGLRVGTRQPRFLAVSCLFSQSLQSIFTNLQLRGRLHPGNIKDFLPSIYPVMAEQSLHRIPTADFQKAPRLTIKA